MTIVFLFFFLSFFASHNAFANSNFTTDYNITYKVLDDLKTYVNNDIALTNKKSLYYPSSYGMKVAFKDIHDVKAYDPNGEIQPVVTKEKDGSSIAVIFNKKSVGVNKKLKFNLSFTTKEITKKLGKIIQIDIPGISNQIEFQNFNVQVLAPKSFGKPAFIKSNKQIKNKEVLNFTKEQIGKSGISITYGKEQIYKFKLSYHLNNPNLFPIKTEIAIPPETSYQEIQIERINPQPLILKKDKDGNTLAQYSLKGLKNLDIVVEGKAKISLLPKRQKVSKYLNDYLKEKPYWQASNKDVKKLAQKLKTPKAIYNYVISNLRYDFSRVTKGERRLGALEILKKPASAVCLEFTDLFVALARAAEIPAREINGFAYTNNSKIRPLSLVKDVLHAWPEYYDKNLQTWVMVDPTWGNTTGGMDYFHNLDFSHIAFVIKGQNSIYPIPAGRYKTKENSTKDVIIEFDSESAEFIPHKL